jgi:Cu(I)/Ag(I) efflux system membrane fusion protein
MLGHRWVIPLLTLLLGGALGVALFWGWQQAQEPSAAIPSPSAKPAGRTILYYRNPMGLPDISATPKKDEMGMPYLPVYADEAGNTPSGSATITVSPDRIQALGVTTEPVRRERLQRTLRAVGQLVVDERRSVTVAPKFGGWIERLPVNTTGQTVHAGETLLEVYSPELIAAQQEYLLARESQNRLRLEPSLAGGKRISLSDGALQRLRFWDIPEGELQRLVRQGEVRRRLPLTAPSDGVVMSKKAVQGMRFEAGEPLFELADLRHLWLLVELFEQDLASIRIGQPVSLTMAAYPGERFSGKVAFIYPTVNAQTRTVSVRIELLNEEGRLKPAMYGEAQLQATVAESLTIPESALLDTGARRLVLLSLGAGRFAPREVEVGAYGEDPQGQRRIVVLSGLQAGEVVVTRANFLLDSESNLRAAFAGLAPTAQSVSASGAPATSMPTSGGQ